MYGLAEKDVAMGQTRTYLFPVQTSVVGFQHDVSLSFGM